MSTDWHVKIDSYYKKNQKTRQQDKKKAEEKFEKIDEQDKRQFKCHVCDSTPDLKQPRYVFQPPGERIPKDHKKCALCGKWTCKKCMHRKICAKCGRRLPWKIWVKRMLGMKWLPEEKDKK